MDSKAEMRRERLLRYLEREAPLLKEGFKPYTRTDKKIEEILTKACEDPLSDEEYYLIVTRRVEKIVRELHGRRRNK